VIGRTGSGKTAIYQKLLLERAHDYFSFGHNFDDYPWHHHDLQTEIGVPEERRYVHSWKYLILMSVSKILLNQDMSQPWSEGAQDSLGLLENFVVDSYGSRNPDVTQLFLPDRELHFKGQFKIGPLQLRAEHVTLRDLPSYVQEVNQVVQANVLTFLNPDHEYFVCFDQLALVSRPMTPSISGA
jgi:hypothetical protein